MVKVFVSVPMNKRDPSVVTREQYLIAEIFSRTVVDDCALIMSCNPKAAETLTPAECMVRALDLLAQADVAIFTHDHEKHCGCSLEYKFARSYNIPVWVLGEDNKMYFEEPGEM